MYSSPDGFRLRVALLLMMLVSEICYAKKLSITYDAEESKCSAECSSCSSISSPDGVDRDDIDGNALDQQILNNTVANSRAIEQVQNTINQLTVKVLALNATIQGIEDISKQSLKTLLELNNKSSTPTQPDTSPSNSKPKSCGDIKANDPTSVSGEYEVVNSDGETKTIYCSFDTHCGSGGGWTRIAYLDMSDPKQNCPNELKYYTKGNLRVCGRQTSSGGSCNSMTFSANVSYSEVCGRVTGYQNGQTGALNKRDQDVALRDDINSYYMDGISLTRGSPRKHVWTFMAGNEEKFVRKWDCPCNTGFNVLPVPSFIGKDYFCESSYPTFANEWTFITSDPLWDNDQYCKYLEGPCCTGFPWFHKVLNTSTTDYLEFRICSDDSTNVDTPVSLYEIYVK